ncbi:efflux RND transporter periplasmic adaptor subunit [Candidatus Nomurabacteria bacterium]|nr:efflux RND transporter periplasmic adaptor subunit [Candidatus Nomurabacteria bacterium]
MKKMFNFVKDRKKYFFIGAPVLLLVLYFFFSGGKNDTELYIVERGDIVQSVSLSGKITTSDKADLGFAASGRIANIYVKNNQAVLEGQTLAQLEIGDLLADLKIKELNSKNSGLSLNDAKENLEQVIEQENTKVKNAYRELLSEDLELIPSSTNYTVEAPTVKGIYDGPEGQYKVRIYRENSSDSDLTISTFNLEQTKRLVKDEGSTLLGTRGLYISFPDDISSYRDTSWLLDIPNKTSSSYLANYNAYNEAKNDKDLAIKDAEFEYQKLLNEDDGGASVAEAEIQKIRAEIRKNTIYAPFKGVVTNIEKEIGENADLGERVISLLGEEKLEVVLQVSELDVSKLVPGASIKISLDAIKGEDFYGVLKTVNSRETEIEGVPVYEAFVELDPDPRIKSGMNASGTTILETKDDVIAIPSYLVEKVGEKNIVKVVLADGTEIEREVTLGLVGTDSMVEIVSGLSLGEKVIASASAKK